MERIKQIATQLIQIAKELKLNDLSQDCLFSESIKLYLSEKIQENKEKNINSFKKEKTEEKDRPTEKQINFLKRFKISNIDKLNKAEATKIIKEYIENQK